MRVAFVDSNAVGLNALRAARQAGHEVVFIGSRRFAGLIGGFAQLRSGGHADEVVEIESSLDELALGTVLFSLHGQRQLDAVLTVLDFCALPVARCAKRLGLPATSPQAVALAQDKAACRQHIEAHGLRSVPHAVVRHRAAAAAFAAEIGYPMIAKPKRGAASLLTARIDTPERLDAYFAGLGRTLDVPQGVVDSLSDETLIERYVEGPLFSVEIAAAGGELVPLIVSARKRCIADPSIELGTTMPAPVQPSTARALTDYAIDVVKCLELDLGIFHVEVIQGPDGPVLVEVNPRIMGGNMPRVFQLATGVDPYALLVQLHTTGRMPPACREVSAVRAATTRMIGTTAAGQVCAALASDWTAPFAPHLANWQFDVAPGMPVPAMESSYCAGHFQLTRTTPAEASLLAEWVISVAAQATSLDLRRSSEDYLFV
jgi:biotin carboxylase